MASISSSILLSGIDLLEFGRLWSMLVKRPLSHDSLVTDRQKAAYGRQHTAKVMILGIVEAYCPQSPVRTI